VAFGQQRYATSRHECILTLPQLQEDPALPFTSFPDYVVVPENHKKP